MNISEDMENMRNRIASIQARLRELGGGQPALEDAQGNFRQILAATGKAGSSRRLPVPANIDALISQAADEAGVSPSLLRAVAQVESRFNPRAVSSRGAMGLMQLMPGTANDLGVRDPFDPAENLRAGARYLRQQLDRFGGDERLALAAYNAGPGAVQRYHGVPPFSETRRYIENVLSLTDGVE
ncbi:MAG: lytic transglycosylase domain-containing protein [Armatimonadota bacterium]